MVVVTPLVGSPVIHLGRSPPTWHKAQPGARGQVSHPRERSGLLKDSNLASGSRVQCCAGYQALCRVSGAYAGRVGPLYGNRVYVAPSYAYGPSYYGSAYDDD